MCARLQILAKFAPLLRYPGQDYARRITALIDALPATSNAIEPLRKLAEFLQGATALQREEEYTRTFDINPSVTLDVGFHLFGLAYKRGEFLVKIREALRQVGMNEGTELPDHLPTLLELAAALGEDEGTSLIEECVFPAVARMAQAVGESARGFLLPLCALHAFLAEHFRCVLHLIEDAGAEASAATQAYVYAPIELDELQTGVPRHA